MESIPTDQPLSGSASISAFHDSLSVSESVGPHVCLHTGGPICKTVPPFSSNVAQHGLPPQPSFAEQAGFSPCTSPRLLTAVDVPTQCLFGSSIHLALTNQVSFTNASLLGWGAHLGLLRVERLWSESEVLLHIKVLELWAIHNACRAFQTLGGSHIH